MQGSVGILVNTLEEIPTFIGKCNYMTHWGRVTHICVSKLTIIGSDNGLSPGRRQAITCSNAVYIFNWTLRNELQWNLNRNVYIFIQENVFETVVCEMTLCVGLNVSMDIKKTQQSLNRMHNCMKAKQPVNLHIRSYWGTDLHISWLW